MLLLQASDQGEGTGVSAAGESGSSAVPVDREGRRVMGRPTKGAITAERNEYLARIQLLEEANARLRGFIAENKICSHGCEFCKRMNIKAGRISE